MQHQDDPPCKVLQEGQLESKKYFDGDEKLSLSEFRQSTYHEPVVKLLKVLQKRLRQEVVEFDLATGDAAQLSFCKARLDGATKLIHEFEGYLDKVKG